MSNSHDFDDNDETIIAHFSPKEIEDLNFLQNGEHKDEATGLPSFLPLLQMLMQPEIMEKISQLSHESPSKEGIAQFIEDSGRFGDSKAAVLPRELADFFDMMLNKGKPSVNPHTGKREYFLGNLLGSIGNLFSPVTKAVSSIGSALAPAAGGLISKLAPMAGNAISEGIGKLGNSIGMGDLGAGIGGAVGNAVNSVGQMGASQLQNGGLDPSALMNHGISALAGGVKPYLSPAINAAANQVQHGIHSLSPMIGGMASDAAMGLGTALGAPEIGAAMSGLAGNAASSLSNMGADAIGNLMRHVSGNISNNNAPMQGAGRNVASSAGNYINNNYGNTPMGAAVGQGMQAYGNNASPAQALMAGTQGGINQLSNPYARLGAQGGFNTMQNYMGGQSPFQAMANGFGSVNPQYYNNAMNNTRNYFNRRSAV